MKKIFFCSLLITLSLIYSDVFSFSIEPARVELTIPAGRQKGKTIMLDNSKGDTPLHIKIYLQDLNYLSDGTSDFLPPGSTEWSCADWVKVVPAEVDIPAGKIKNVRVSIEVPDGVKGGGYSTLFFEAGMPGPNKGIGINFRMGVMVLVTVQGTEVYQAKLSDFVFNKPEDIEVSIFNQGNVLVRPNGEVKFINSKGKRVKSLDLNPRKLGILPSTVRKFGVKLDSKLPAGKYTLKTEIDFGQDYLLVGELLTDFD